jgi:hypothetical protein
MEIREIGSDAVKRFEITQNYLQKQSFVLVMWSKILESAARGDN